MSCTRRPESRAATAFATATVASVLPLSTRTSEKSVSDCAASACSVAARPSAFVVHGNHDEKVGCVATIGHSLKIHQSIMNTPMLIPLAMPTHITRSPARMAPRALAASDARNRCRRQVTVLRHRRFDPVGCHTDRLQQFPMVRDTHLVNEDAGEALKLHAGIGEHLPKDAGTDVREGPP